MFFTFNDLHTARTIGTEIAADPGAAGADFGVVVTAALIAGDAGDALFADFLTGLMAGVDRRRAGFAKPNVDR